MRIISLKAENVKRLKAVEIRPDGNMVTITGRNSQGKTAVLDAIWMALAGAAGAKEVSRPIRDGEEKASVELDLGDLVVTRKWTKAGTTLEVKTTEGAKYSSPQTVLDELIGRLTFDPLAFAEQSEKEQLTTLLSVVDLPFDPATVDTERAQVFDRRTDVNREAKRIEAILSGSPVPPDGTPDEEVSAAEIAAELEAVLEAARIRGEVEQRFVQARRDVDAKEQALERERESLRAAEALAAAAQERITRVTLEAQELQEALDAATAEGKALPAAVEQAPIRARLAEVDTTNSQVRAKKAGASLRAELKTATDEAETLTATLERIDRSKEEAIAAARMPLEGLSFDETGVLYNGVPFSQSSSSERLRVGIAVAMALNPKIRVIRITDGSLLDSASLALIEEMAGEHDFQCWVERIDETGTVGIVIEDGMVADSSPQPDVAKQEGPHAGVESVGEYLLNEPLIAAEVASPETTE